MGPAERLTRVRARSGDARFLDALGKTDCSGRVHSVFARVVNVESAAGELWTLAGRTCDNAPNTLIVDAPGFSAYPLAPGELFRASAQELRFASGLTVVLAAAARWDDRLPVYPDDDTRLRANVARIEAVLAQRNAGQPAASESTVLRVVDSQLLRQMARLGEALSRSDLEAAAEHALGVVGLGPGLTPSGDDCLTGFFAVLNIEGSPGYRFRSLGAEVASRAAGLTNAISLAALKMAAGGRVREAIVALLRAALAADEASLDASLARVLAIGSTSGADIVGGIVVAFRLGLGLAPRR